MHGFLCYHEVQRLIMIGKALMTCFFILLFFGEGDQTKIQHKVTFTLTRVMSVVKEGGNKPVYTDFFIRILFTRIARQELKIKNFLRIMLRLAYHTFQFLLSNIILGKNFCYLPLFYYSQKLLTVPSKVYVFNEYFQIQFLLQLTIHLRAATFSRKKFVKFSVQTFANGKMTCISRGINFSDVEIYKHVLINHSARKLLQKLENYSF